MSCHAISRHFYHTIRNCKVENIKQTKWIESSFCQYLRGCPSKVPIAESVHSIFHWTQGWCLWEQAGKHEAKIGCLLCSQYLYLMCEVQSSLKRCVCNTIKPISASPSWWPIHTRSQVLRFGGPKCIFRVARFFFYYMFKTNFEDTTKFAGSQKLGELSPNAPACLRAWAYPIEDDVMSTAALTIIQILLLSGKCPDSNALALTFLSVVGKIYPWIDCSCHFQRAAPTLFVIKHWRIILVGKLLDLKKGKVYGPCKHSAL